MMTDEWYPTVSDGFEGLVIVSGELVYKTGESRSFAVLMTKEGSINDERSYVTAKVQPVRQSSNRIRQTRAKARRKKKT